VRLRRSNVILSVRSKGPYRITVSWWQDRQETCKVFCTTPHIFSTRFISGCRGGQSLRQPFLKDTRIENGGLVLLELYLLRQDKAVCQRLQPQCKKRECPDIRLSYTKVHLSPKNEHTHDHCMCLVINWTSLGLEITERCCPRKPVAALRFLAC